MSDFHHPALAGQYQRLLSLLTDHALQKREVALSSGGRSNFYLDCKQVSLSAEGHFLIGQLFYALITKLAPNAEAVGGLTMGADPIASAISLVSFLAGRPLAAFLVRKQPKEHGTQQWLEGDGNLRPGMPVVIVEDVITSGAPTMRALDRARAAGLRVERVFALVDREHGGRDVVEVEAPVTVLYRRRDFLP